MSTLRTSLATLVLVALPAAGAAQCAIDVIEEGVSAYRALTLEASQQLLDSALALNARSSSPCSTENATALAYRGAGQWLLRRPDDARRSFERAIIGAPRFRPDPIEFPPEITDAFDEVRRRTPSVTVEVPETTSIGPQGGESLVIRLMASTTHWVTVAIQETDGERRRTVFQGPVEEGARATVLGWDGHDASGAPLESGWYDLEVVSTDGTNRPVRKVVTELRVESDAAPERPPVLDTARLPAPDRLEGSTAKALAALGAGLVGGALIAVAPEVIDGAPDSRARYGVVAAVSLTGVLGFVQQLRNRGRSTPSDDRAYPGAEAAPAPPRTPTLIVRAGFQRRVELDAGAALPDETGTPSRTNQP